MSLEAKIEALTASVDKLIATLTTPDRLAAASDTGGTAPATPAKKATKSAPAAASVAPTSPTQTAAPTPQPVADTEPAKPASPVKVAPTMEDARPLAIELGQKKGRDALTGLLTKFGASKLPEVPPHQYGAFIEQARQLLAA